jgi:hypothetical protein
MTWNYRVLSYKDTAEPDCCGIHEVFYDEDGKPDSCTLEAVGVVGDSFEDLRKVYLMMAEAFAAPVLEYGSFKGSE